MAHPVAPLLRLCTQRCFPHTIDSPHHQKIFGLSHAGKLNLAREKFFKRFETLMTILPPCRRSEEHFACG